MQVTSFASKSSNFKFSFCRKSCDYYEEIRQQEKARQKHQDRVNSPEYQEMLDLIQKSQVPGGIFDDKDQKRLNELIEKFMYFNNGCKDEPPTEAIDS